MRGSKATRWVLLCSMASGNTTTYRRPSVSIGQGLGADDYSYLTKPSKDGSGFFVQFNVPFKKQDVFNELLADSGPVGTEAHTGTTSRILKAGREQGKLVCTHSLPRRMVLSVASDALTSWMRMRLAGIERLRARNNLSCASVGQNHHRATRDQGTTRLRERTTLVLGTLAMLAMQMHLLSRRARSL